MTEDAELVRGSVGAPELFDEIFDRHYDAILRYARQRVGYSVGEEIASRTFVIAFERRHAYDPKRISARPWLYGIATNLIRRHHRDEKTHLTALARLPLDPDPDDIADVDKLDADRSRSALLQALDALPAVDRDAFVLFAVSELTYEEIAQALDVPVGTVRSRIHRARHRLRELLEAQLATTDDDPAGAKD